MTFHKIIIYFILIFFISCQNQKEPQNCEQEIDREDSLRIDYYLNDSIRIDRHFFRSFPTSEKDSVYRFQGLSGWGTFDFLCSVYNSDNQYFLELTHNKLLNLKGDIIKTTTPISGELWSDFVHTIDTLGFWCEDFDMFKQFELTILDGDAFYAIAKEKEKMRVVKWQPPYKSLHEHPGYSEYKRIIEDYYMLITKGLSKGNYPLEQGIVNYFKKGDSLQIKAYNRYSHSFVVKNTEVFLQEKSITKNGEGNLIIHKSDSVLLKKIKFVETYHDGTVRVFYPDQIKEVRD